ncbi:hypothetical protein [uncultured Maribacter sp.]|uniref:hypothetical protein n=1 Tax=uncultured Maribacter sp. TaxID=431308 RepID=UPI0030ED351D|tara:strand:- start:28726 stop:29430 length:705 start_codon:yes stop_codon:yes gene_type:complete
MKIIKIIIFNLWILLANISNGQDMQQNEVLKLVDLLNNTMSENIQFTLKKNKAVLHWNDVSDKLDLRNDSEIAKDSMSKEEIDKRLYDSGRYIGNIYWQYDFEPTTSVKTSFKANKFGLIFLKLKFQEKDTININSKLNAYSCVHSTLDSSPHQVQWTGDNYISLLLKPQISTNNLKFKVYGITISGKFEKKDNGQMAKNYTKKLRTVLKREFQQLFNNISLIYTPKNSYEIAN